MTVKEGESSGLGLFQTACYPPPTYLLLYKLNKPVYAPLCCHSLINNTVVYTQISFYLIKLERVWRKGFVRMCELKYMSRESRLRKKLGGENIRVNKRDRDCIILCCPTHTVFLPKFTTRAFFFFLRNKRGLSSGLCSPPEVPQFSDWSLKYCLSRQLRNPRLESCCAVAGKIPSTGGSSSHDCLSFHDKMTPQ